VLTLPLTYLSNGNNEAAGSNCDGKHTTSSHQRLFNTLKEINIALRRTKLDLTFLCLWPLNELFVSAIFRSSSCMFLNVAKHAPF